MTSHTNPTAGKGHSEGAHLHALLGAGGVSRRARLPIDPRTKLFFLLICNALLLGTRNSHLVLPIGSVVLILLMVDSSLTRGIQFCATIAVLYLLLFTPGWLPNILTAAIAGFAFYGLRFYICIMIAYWMLSTTKISHFIQSLHALRLPVVLIIPLSVMLRFFPVVISECRGVLEAMKIRGYSGSKLWLHPLRTIELIVVPTLSAIARIADELAAAALIRGLGSPGRPTQLGTGRFSLADAVLLLFTIVVLGWRLASSRWIGLL
ncbi:energy-coupling factor transporter transmembrane component T [Corynebacterium felinum]|uniref:Energy-coupling factor transport system permease protein n=1 Tax=Corynebacterium felinum TaxID=131318 RepID=A0ABU2B6J3_9CORY|nr:energy-coupling factor transporter transmembrane component T [Corynebacterium felinum]MDF5820724.1 energy-coupling factor transporter transmembrane component T [Corynebacterium felinum]MDR7354230.1 energy-coupling factor transport system permease protein [Corynebacterium felinum]WJY96399.1 Energy-coupling factor transporter transmembrane protein EcfT [Corynebacterium felinum]